MKVRLFAILMAVALLVGVAGIPSAAAQDDMAMVRVIHASPDAPAVDIYVNGEAVDALTNVPFFTASNFLSLPAGDQQVAVAPAGTSVDSAVISATVTLNAGSAYSIAAVGLLGDESLQAQVYEENLSPTADGEARVYVYHFSPDAPAVDIRLADGTVLAEGLAFPNKGELTVPAGTYDIQVVPSGETEPVVIDLAGTTLEAGTLYSVFATNTLAEITPQLSTTALTAEAAAPEATEDPTPEATEEPATETAPEPAPDPTPEPAAPDTPATLPETAESNSVPTTALVLVALALVGTGALVLARRRSSS